MKDKNVLKNKWKAPKSFMFFVFFCLILIVAQLVYVSLFPNLYGINMKTFAANRNTYSTALYAKRGTIYDSENNALALNVSSYTVIAYLSKTRTGSSKTPKHVVDIKKTAEQLSPILNMTVEKLTELLSKNVYQVELGPGGRGISELVKQEIEDLKLPGIDFVESYKRYYPNGDFASYILGYAKSNEVEEKDGKKTTEIVGELGLESKYNEWLTGTNGYLSYQRDRYGYKIPDTVENRVEAIDGANIYLTLDSNIQRFTESAMRDLESTYAPSWGTITVMNAKTGEILASSSIPTFDPNVRNITNYQSPTVTYTYEPGSTMKIYSYMCAIDSGKYDGSKVVKSGSLMIGDDEVRDWNRVGWGYITLDKGFAYSSNVAASTLVQSVITKTEYRNCLEKFGFGETTGVELANESSGSINFTYPIEVATASFGQGVTTTVMQHLQGLSIIANDGKKITPRIVKKIVDPNTKQVLYESTINKSEQLVKTSTVNKIKDLMYEVVNSVDGNASGAGYRTYSVKLIGKTGTAQIASTHGGYLTGINDYIYSFAGMFPSSNPEIIVYAAIQRPAYSGYAALSKAVKEVVNNIAKYKNMDGAITNDSSVKTFEVGSYYSKDTQTVVEQLQANSINPVVIGNGTKIIKQYPSNKTKILSNDKVLLITNDSNVTIPDLTGWSKKDVQNILQMINVKYEFEGTGYANAQSIPPGTAVTDDLSIKVIFSDKYNLDEVN